MTDPENDPANDPEVTETPDVAAKGYTAKEPLVTDTGDRIWVADGNTYRETPNGSQYVAAGDHTDTVVALTALYGF